MIIDPIATAVQTNTTHDPTAAPAPLNGIARLLPEHHQRLIHTIHAVSEMPLVSFANSILIGRVQSKCRQTNVLTTQQTTPSTHPRAPVSSARLTFTLAARNPRKGRLATATALWVVGPLTRRRINHERQCLVECNTTHTHVVVMTHITLTHASLRPRRTTASTRALSLTGQS